MNQPDDMQQLYEKLMDNTASASEVAQFLSWFNSHAAEPETQSLLMRQMDEPVEDVRISSAQQQRLEGRLQQILEAERSTRQTGRVRLLRRWMAAAALLLLVASGAWFWIHRAAPEKDIALVPATAIRPANSSAVLTLADGRQILLDSVANGQLAGEGVVALVKSDGQLVYKGETSEVLYNTISVPKGRQWQLSLSDGTQVWLNAQSSIRYPVSFTGSERVVEISGEAYFEVAAQSKAPFRVTTNQQEITVLGTHFNINAYADEPIHKTTLLEGKVQVAAAGNSVVLQPGEQAMNNYNAGDLKVQAVDVAGVTAWINGRFRFDHSDIKTVMRQIVRWYDVEVEYRGSLPDYRFTGGTFRNVNLSEVLQVLELSGVHFTLENHKIIVMP